MDDNNDLYLPVGHVRNQRYIKNQVKPLSFQDYQHFQDALSLGNLGTWQYDFKKASFFFDNRSCKIFKVPPGSDNNGLVMDFDAFLYIFVANPDKSLFEYYFKNMFEGPLLDAPKQFEYRVKKGHFEFIHTLNHVRLKTQGRKLIAEGLMKDITEFRHQEKALRLCQANLERLQKQAENKEKQISKTEHPPNIHKEPHAWEYDVLGKCFYAHPDMIKSLDPDTSLDNDKISIQKLCRLISPESYAVLKATFLNPNHQHVPDKPLNISFRNLETQTFEARFRAILGANGQLIKYTGELQSNTP